METMFRKENVLPSSKVREHIVGLNLHLDLIYFCLSEIWMNTQTHSSLFLSKSSFSWFFQQLTGKSKTWRTSSRPWSWGPWTYSIKHYQHTFLLWKSWWCWQGHWWRRSWRFCRRGWGIWTSNGHGTCSKRTQWWKWWGHKNVDNLKALTDVILFLSLIQYQMILTYTDSDKFLGGERDVIF